MKINVVELVLKREYELEIPSATEYIYGVESAAPVFCNIIGSNNVEYVALLCLDSTNRIINLAKVSIGNIENVSVSIPQIIKIALLSNSSKMMIAHNHPSGILEVTHVDIDMTKKIGAIANYFDIKLIDSLVVNNVEAVSIREKMGEIKNEG
ncbi:MAG: JAB domain-containing protein [Ruminococcus sp.]|nr:JAB domain-containing protein [Ruminococcus sp.]